MIYLTTERLVLRDWQEKDRDLFREINRDPKVMEFYPHRRSHAEADEMMERINRLIAEDGHCFLAVAPRDTDEAMGYCGLSTLRGLEPALPDGTVEIGWRLATRFWGQGYVTEAARALLHYGFETRGLDEIVSFAVTDNHRSIAVMRRLGMREDVEGSFDHPRVPDTHPHLKRHALYRLTAAQYRAQQAR